MKTFRRIILLAVLCFLTSCASNGFYNVDTSQYPFLKSEARPDRLYWQRFESVDFLVFNGHLAHNKPSSVGFYLGFVPNFPPEEPARVVKGQLGIFSVDWYETLSDTPPKVRREGLIRPPKDQSSKKRIPLVHVWIRGNTEADIEKMADELGKIALFTKGPNQFFSEGMRRVEDKPNPFEWQQSRRIF